MYRTLVLCCIKECIWHAHYGLFVAIIILCWKDEVVYYYTLAFYVATSEKTLLMSSLFVNFVLGTTSWMICSRQLSILSRILKLHMTGSKSSIAMLLILSEISLLFFNFMLIRPAFSTPSIIFAHCQLRLVLFVSPHILHSLSFRQVHIYLKNMRNKHYCGAWDVMLWDGFQGPLAIYKTLHGTHRNYAV